MILYKNKTEHGDESKAFLIEDIPPDDLEYILDLYRTSVIVENYTKLIFVFIVFLFVMHHILFGSKSLDYNVYKTIKTVEFFIIGTVAPIIFIMAGIAIFKYIKVNKLLKQVAIKYHIDAKIVQDEFNSLATHLFGGKGVILLKGKGINTLL